MLSAQGASREPAGIREWRLESEIHCITHVAVLAVNHFCKLFSRGMMYYKHLRNVLQCDWNQDEIAILEEMV